MLGVTALWICVYSDSSCQSMMTLIKLPSLLYYVIDHNISFQLWKIYFCFQCFVCRHCWIQWNNEFEIYTCHVYCVVNYNFEGNMGWGGMGWGINYALYVCILYMFICLVICKHKYMLLCSDHVIAIYYSYFHYCIYNIDIDIMCMKHIYDVHK